MTREVMQQALDLLESHGCITGDNAAALHAVLREALAKQSEPFGYFRAEPFGWVDCAPDAEGAKALYDHPGLDGPRWHDAPTCEGKWISSTAVSRVVYPAAYANTGKKWYGPIPKRQKK